MTLFESIQTVGVLGPVPTYGYFAAKSFFAEYSPGISYVECVSHRDVCDRVGRFDLDAGLVAIENSVDGIVMETLRSVEDQAGKGLRVCGEVILPVRHFLLSRTGDSESIREIVSHQSAINQCNRLLDEYRHRGVKVIPVESTGKAAARAFESSDGSVAAISSEEARRQYELVCVGQSHAMDYANVLTRFWVLSRFLSAPSRKDRNILVDPDKTSIILDLKKDRVGALRDALGCFSNRKVSLLTIYSRPLASHGYKDGFEYSFLLEMDGHISDPDFDSAFMDLQSQDFTYKPLVIGSYKKATL